MPAVSLSRAAAIAALAFLVALPAAAQQAEEQRLTKAAAVFEAITSVPERAVPEALMRSVYGIAIFPEVQRVGFIIGGQRGKGVLVVRSGGSWSRPLFLSITGGSIGWQIGVQKADVVLFFRTRGSVDRVLEGKYTVGVDASVAAGSLGREASALTDKSLQAELYTYARTRGIFAGLALQGAALDIDYPANAKYYGREIDLPQDVLSGAGLPDPPSAGGLRRAIDGYTPSPR